MEGFPAETSEDDITLSQFLNTIESEKNETNNTRSAEYSENIGLIHSLANHHKQSIMHHELCTHKAVRFHRLFFNKM
jgi:hypothetical protein